MGNISLPPPKGKRIEKGAAEFLVDKVSEFPNEVSILALGPLTNLALVSYSVPSSFNRTSDRKVMYYLLQVITIIYIYMHRPSKGTRPLLARLRGLLSLAGLSLHLGM